jgi:hypothetical protein
MSWRHNGEHVPDDAEVGDTEDRRLRHPLLDRDNSFWWSGIPGAGSFRDSERDVELGETSCRSVPPGWSGHVNGIDRCYRDAPTAVGARLWRVCSTRAKLAGEPTASAGDDSGSLRSSLWRLLRRRHAKGIDRCSRRGVDGDQPQGGSRTIRLRSRPGAPSRSQATAGTVASNGKRAAEHGVGGDDDVAVGPHRTTSTSGPVETNGEPDCRSLAPVDRVGKHDGRR